MRYITEEISQPDDWLGRSDADGSPGSTSKKDGHHTAHCVNRTWSKENRYSLASAFDGGIFHTTSRRREGGTRRDILL